MEKEGLKCLFCGGDLCWESDSNANDTYAEFSESDSAIVSYFHCTKCGRTYEICEPTEDERNSTYNEYWNNNRK